MERLLHLLVVLMCSTALCFALTEALPGDAATMLSGEGATPAQEQALRERLGLDRPLPVRYVQWLGGALSGDFGLSWRTGEAIAPMLRQRLAVSLELMLFAIAGALIVSVPLSLMAVRWRGTPVERVIGALALVALSTPTFVVALLLILLLAVPLSWGAAIAYTAPSTGLGAHLASMALPALSLITAEVPVQLRILRGELEEVIEAPYLRTARAYGAGEWQLLVGRALRPASAGFVTVTGLNIAGLIAGAIVVESVFAIPGMGRLLVDAVYSRDLPVIQGCVLLIGTAYVVVNLTADLLCRWIDPRSGFGS